VNFTEDIISGSLNSYIRISTAVFTFRSELFQLTASAEL